MLYDQALLVKAYLEAYQISKNELYRARPARPAIMSCGTCNIRKGFYSAEDADSLDPYQPSQDPGLSDKDKKEGAFYLWRHEELERISGETYAGIFNFYFGITREGNVLTDPHGEFTQRTSSPLQRVWRKLLPILKSHAGN